MKIHEIITETTAGAIATVAMPMGKIVKRANPSIYKTKKTNEKAPCWTGYKQVGMKKKGKKQVPNCIPERLKAE